MKSVFLSLIIAILISSPTLAARPLETEGAYALDQGKLEIELGAKYIEYKDQNEDYEIKAAIRYGLLPIVELYFEAPYLITDPDTSGPSDATASVKFEIFEETFALIVGTKLASGDKDKGLGTGETDTFVNGVLSKRFDSKAIHINVGYTALGGETDSLVSYGIAIENNFVEGAAIAGEVVGSTLNTETSSTSILNTLIGVNWELYDWLVADAGLIIGLSADSPRNSATAGLTIRP
jgi:hypothetical protein